MRKLYKPDKSELEALRAQATQNGMVSEGDWVIRNIELTSGILRREPLRYRSYGPYWWTLKQTLINHGIDDFGEFIDREWFELADYGSEFHNLLAALLYSNSAMDAGLIHSNAHNVAFLPEEEGMEYEEQVYSLADDEMELLALQENLTRY